MLRKFTVIALLSFAMAGWANAAKPDANPPVKIMTQNMDDGTDQTYIIAALAFNALPLPDAVDLTYLELVASNFEGRAGLMAARIAEEKPHLVAIQEAALWRTGSSPSTATTVLADQLDLLLKALKAAGVPYDVVAVNHLSDLALPGGSAVGALRFTDRNAILVRSDLRPPEFHLSNVHARTFATAFPFTVSEDLTLTIPAGWISVDVHMGNKQFRFVTTHLESPLAGIPEATAVQVAQAQELIHALRNLTIPVVICGDFNSDANRGGGVEDTGTFHLFETAGYADAWPVANPGNPGFTWPIYLEDLFFPPPFFILPDSSTTLERIDLFFSKGMTVNGVELVKLAPVGPWPALAPPFASDHAGVIAVFRP